MKKVFCILSALIIVSTVYMANAKEKSPFKKNLYTCLINEGKPINAFMSSFNIDMEDKELAKITVQVIESLDEIPVLFYVTAKPKTVNNKFTKSFTLLNTKKYKTVSLMSDKYGNITFFAKSKATGIKNAKGKCINLDDLEVASAW